RRTACSCCSGSRSASSSTRSPGRPCGGRSPASCSAAGTGSSTRGTAARTRGLGGKPLVVGVRWSFADKDAGSPDSSAIRATADAAQRARSVRRRLRLVFAKPSYKARGLAAATEVLPREGAEAVPRALVRGEGFVVGVLRVGGDLIRDCPHLALDRRTVRG